MSVYLGNNLLAGAIDAANQDGSNITNSFSTSLVNNMSDTANSYMAKLGMPSDTYESLTVGASGTQYTAPSNGWVLVSGRGSGQLVVYTTVSYMTSGVGYNTSSPPATTFIPVKKGDYFKVEYYNMNSIGIRFIYAVGSESEGS
jgi:hypothetical protein